MPPAFVEPVAIYSWGYWGWGTAAAEFVRAVDAVEASRGYAPPAFVDIRINRSVRAPGFRSRAFERLLGPERHRWMRSLGNRAAGDRAGLVDIQDPSKADDLLDLAGECAHARRRVLFFCACEFPGIEGQRMACHRVTVARLVLEAARRRDMRVAIDEWPGGDPLAEGVQLSVPAAAFRQLASGRKSVVLGDPERRALQEMASLPWGSVVSVRCENAIAAEPVHVIAGPAKYRRGGWFLPVFKRIEHSTVASAQLLAADWRRGMGFGRRASHG